MKAPSRFIGANFPTDLAVKIDRYAKLNHMAPQKAMVKIVELYFIGLENEVTISLVNGDPNKDAPIFREPGKYTQIGGVSFDNERIKMHDVQKAHPCRTLFSYKD